MATLVELKLTWVEASAMLDPASVSGPPVDVPMARMPDAPFAPPLTAALASSDAARTPPPVDPPVSSTPCEDSMLLVMECPKWTPPLELRYSMNVSVTRACEYSHGEHPAPARGTRRPRVLARGWNRAIGLSAEPLARDHDYAPLVPQAFCHVSQNHE